MEIDDHGSEFCPDENRGLTRREFIAVAGTVAGSLVLEFPDKDNAASAPEPSLGILFRFP